MTGVVDNDVLYKGACYGLLDELGTFMESSLDLVGILGAAPYVVRASIRRAKLRCDIAVAIDRLDRFLATAALLEPSDQERDLAAAIELAAQHQALPLHSGESQLCAIAALRGLARVLTGDKQSVVALETMLDLRPELAVLAGRVFCLEQAILSISASLGVEEVRSRVCSEPAVDRALSMCFSCASGVKWPNESASGLLSYIESLRTEASRVLAA